MFQSVDHIQGLLREYWCFFDLERTVYQLALVSITTVAFNSAFVNGYGSYVFTL